MKTDLYPSIRKVYNILYLNKRIDKCFISYNMLFNIIKYNYAAIIKKIQIITQ